VSREVHAGFYERRGVRFPPATHPSLVWLWPIVVLLACVVAAWRTRRAELDRSVARLLANVALVSIAIAGLGLKLHGRPGVSIFQLVELGFILAFVGRGLWQSLLRTPGYFVCLLIGVGAIWAGGVLIPTLLDGFVLIALPAFLARAVTVLCLGCGIGLLLFVTRLSELADRRLARSRPSEVLDHEHGGVTESRA
jgi:hypothetical protein